MLESLPHFLQSCVKLESFLVDIINYTNLILLSLNYISEESRLVIYSHCTKNIMSFGGRVIGFRVYPPTTNMTLLTYTLKELIYCSPLCITTVNLTVRKTTLEHFKRSRKKICLTDSLFASHSNTVPRGTPLSGSRV